MNNSAALDLDPHVLIAILAVVIAVAVLVFLFGWLNVEKKLER
ncbi:MAG TPA: hypothetical protein VGF34_00845 [Stellaceae bacterium]|jgi:hypothetical protein